MEMTFKSVLPVLAVVIALLGVVSGVPTVYIKNEEDKFQPALLPISSTVIPLSVYKVSYGVDVVDNAKYTKPEEPTKLITVHNKKKYSEKTPAKVKQVSKEEFEKQHS